MRRKKKKWYYAGLIKATNTLFVTKTKAELARQLHISVDTISRHLSNSTLSSTDNLILWSHIPIDTVKRGFYITRRV